MKKTIVINLMGGPGAGKSTFATMLFSYLKKNGISCEYVEEFAKGLVWEGRNFTLKDQLFILANQNYNLLKVYGKVNVIITDSPLLLSMYYNDVVDKDFQYNVVDFDKIVMDCYSRYDNLVYCLERNFPYVKEGRYQTEEESLQVNSDILKMLDEKKIPYQRIESNDKYVKEVSDFVISLLKFYNNEKKNDFEFERRYLLKSSEVLKLGLPCKRISQTYLDIGQTEKRVRSVDNKKFYYTEKNGEGNIREEYETEINEEEFNYFLTNFKKGKSIVKDRYSIPIMGAKKCEINVFHQPKKLNLVEVEFENEEQMKKFKAPDWFGDEVTSDKSYNSASIANEL